MRLEVHQRCEAGPLRTVNEDRVLALPERGLFAVIDGMGGGEDGARAAAVLAEQLEAHCTGRPDAGLLVRTLERVDAQLQDEARRRGLSRPMAAVVAVAWVDLDDPEGRTVVANVGDSRVFLFDERGDGLQLTRDHSWADLDALPEAEAMRSRLRHVITAAVGLGAHPADDGSPWVHTEIARLPPGSTIVLVTDGVGDFIDRAAIARFVSGSERSAEAVVHAIFDGAVAQQRARGTGDNLGVAVVHRPAPRGGHPMTHLLRRAPFGLSGSLFLLLVLVAAAAAWLRLEALAVSQDGALLLPGSAADQLAPVVSFYDDPDDQAFALGVLAERVEELQGSRALSLEAIAFASVGVDAALPDPEHAPLVNLRARIDAAELGQDRVLLLGEQGAHELWRRMRLEGLTVRASAEWRRGMLPGLALWVGAWLSLGLGLALVAGALRRPGEAGADRAPAAWRLLAAMAAISALRLVLQGAWQGPLDGGISLLAGGGDVAIAAGLVLAALVILQSAWSRWGAAVARISAHWPALGLAMAGVLALGLFGVGPAGSDAHINLPLPVVGSVQPLEAVKVALLVGVAAYLGRHRFDLATPGLRLGPVPLPHLRLLLPGLLGLVVVLACGLWLEDYGAVMVIAASLGLLLLAVAGRRALLVSTGLGGVAAALVATGSVELGGKLSTRWRMFVEAWNNGLPGGDQIVHALWALAAGRLWGAGPEHAVPMDIPNGHNDLVLAWLSECFGWGALLAVLALWLVVLHAGLVIALGRPGGRAEDQLIPGALVLLLAAQAAIAALVSFGALPLTGLTAPWLSAGTSAMVAAVFVGAWLAWQGLRSSPGVAHPASPGQPRRFLLCLGAVAVALLVAAGIAGRHAVVHPDATAARPAVTRQADGRIAAVDNPRLARVTPQLPQPEIRDRRGRVVAFSEDGRRLYPYDHRLGAVVGIARDGFSPRRGSLERLRVDATRLFALRTLPVAVVETCEQEACPRACDWTHRHAVRPGSAAEAEALARYRGAGVTARSRIVQVPDKELLVPATRLHGVERRAWLQALRAEHAVVTTTLDAELQADVLAMAERHRQRWGAPAACVVAVDARSGHELVHGCTPGLDPNAVSLAELELPEHSGPFAAQRDLASELALPPGSVFKALVVLAADVAGFAADRRWSCRTGRGADAGRGVLRVRDGDASGTIRDYRGTGGHGSLTRYQALPPSCSVILAQVALDLGLDGLRAVVDSLPMAAFEVSEDEGIHLAAAANGQGGVLMTPQQVAWSFAAIANQGTLVRAELLHTGAEPRVETAVLAQPQQTARLRAALRRVVLSGTARRAREPAGAAWQVHGKTGTSEQELVPGEDGPARDHAWFAGWFEGADGQRVAFAILLPRAGTGGRVAAPLAPELGELLERHGYLPEAVAGR